MEVETIEPIFGKLPVKRSWYDVFDKDTDELLSRGIPMKEVMRRHGSLIDHLELVPVADRVY